MSNMQHATSSVLKSDKGRQTPHGRPRQWCSLEAHLRLQWHLVDLSGIT